MTEADIQNSIRLALSKYAVIFRVNSGKVCMQDGRYFDTGVPNGYTDLSGFRKSDGKAIFIEVKTPAGSLRDTQKQFIGSIEKHPVIIGVCRSAEEAVDLVVNG